VLEVRLISSAQPAAQLGIAADAARFVARRFRASSIEPCKPRVLISRDGPARLNARPVRADANMRLFIPAFILMTMTSPLASAAVPAECGEWPSKEPWQWTDEERLSHRFDEQCLQARRTQAAQDSRRDGFCRSSGKVSDFIFGTDTPELFLPWQLFDTLLQRMFVAEPKFVNAQLQIFEQRARAANVPVAEHFWDRVEHASVEYIGLLRDQHGMAAKFDGASAAERRALQTEIARSQRANCAARQAALERVREEFEAHTFDRFLYVAVAPGLCSSGDSERKMLSWIGRGCPGQR